MESSWALTEDLPAWAPWGVGALVLALLGLLLLEARGGVRGRAVALLTGALAALLLAGAVLRPVSVQIKGQKAGAPIVVLADTSRRLELPAEDGTPRSEHLREALGKLKQALPDARLEVLGFGDRGLAAFDVQAGRGDRAEASDLISALEAVTGRPGQLPRAVVVLSDGRLERPGAGVASDLLRAAAGGVPVHTVALAESGPADASLRSVRATGAAVAHQAFPLSIEVGCDPRLDCGAVPVTVRELLEDAAPVELANGVADASSGAATIELSITLERAGTRVVEVSLAPPSGDELPANDTRFLEFTVARDRVRILHVAGRPTYDVRALRRFLKADESIDLVSFFILRTLRDRTDADDSDLALIPFPVDELFTEHLASFDAVILQDIDAVQYRLDGHLPALAAYVRAGGGTIMVGGPSAFIGGGYAGSPFEAVLPVQLNPAAEPFDRGAFTPRFTSAGRVAPVLGPLRELLDDALPEMVGSNTLGAARPEAVVLWEHPTRTVVTAQGPRPMPMLAVAEIGDGRSIALGVDATHRLGFSELGARAGGRAHGALWEGLLGWLMRDPRYEAARMETDRPCIAGEPLTLRVTPLPGAPGTPQLEVARLGADSAASRREVELTRQVGEVFEFDLGALEAGGYLARVALGSGPPSRWLLPCEAGGDAFSDSRPDPGRLQEIAAATGGIATNRNELGALPSPAPTVIASERRASALLPPWLWTLLATAAMGAHWVARRMSGLA